MSLIFREKSLYLYWFSRDFRCLFDSWVLWIYDKWDISVNIELSMVQKWTKRKKVKKNIMRIDSGSNISVWIKTNINLKKKTIIKMKIFKLNQ